jgi:hypothetical protein
VLFSNASQAKRLIAAIKRIQIILGIHRRVRKAPIFAVFIVLLSIN